MQQLTPREKQIIEFLGDPRLRNHSNKAIAAKLGLTEGTVKEYLVRLTKKLKTDRIGLSLYRYANEQFCLDLREVTTNDVPKAEIQKIRAGSQTAAPRKPFAAPAAPALAPTIGFKTDYKYKSLRPDFLEIP